MDYILVRAVFVQRKTLWGPVDNKKAIIYAIIPKNISLSVALKRNVPKQASKPLDAVKYFSKNGNDKVKFFYM